MKTLAICATVASAIGYFALESIDSRALCGAIFVISCCLVQALYEAP